LNLGDEVKLTLTTRVPSVPGKYVLELDLVQEGVTWFGLKGSEQPRPAANVEYPDALVAT
jgi:hypothetical protein